MLARPQVDLELQPVEAPSWASPNATVYVLMPPLDVLVGQPGFAADSPILVAPAKPAFDARAFFHSGTIH